MHLQAIPLYQKAGAGLAAGGLGALVGSPADLSLIRMQSDATLPPEKRRNYTGKPDCLHPLMHSLAGDREHALYMQADG